MLRRDFHINLRRNFHDSNPISSYCGKPALSLCCHRNGLVENQGGLERWPFAKAAVEGTQGARFGGAGGGIRQGPRAVWSGGGCGGVYLLRGGPRWFLAAAMVGQPRLSQYRGGSGEP